MWNTTSAINLYTFMVILNFRIHHLALSLVSLCLLRLVHLYTFFRLVHGYIRDHWPNASLQSVLFTLILSSCGFFGCSVPSAPELDIPKAAVLIPSVWWPSPVDWWVWGLSLFFPDLSYHPFLLPPFIYLSTYSHYFHYFCYRYNNYASAPEERAKPREMCRAL